MKPLPRSAGQAIVTPSGEVWDRLCDMVEAAANLSVAYPLEIGRSGAGTIISLDQEDREWIAVVTNAGPSGEDDYTDERYWVKLSYVDNKDPDTSDPADETTHLTTSFDLDSDSDPIIVTATNLFESCLDKEEASTPGYETGTHLIPEGRRVHLLWLYDFGSAAAPANRRYFFNIAPVRSVWVQVTGAASGDGWYTGKILKPIDTAPDPTAALSDDAFGYFSDSGDCYIANSAESGTGTHDLTSGTPVVDIFPGSILPRKTSDGKFAVIINGFDTKACSS